MQKNLHRRSWQPNDILRYNIPNSKKVTNFEYFFLDFEILNIVAIVTPWNNSIVFEKVQLHPVPRLIFFFQLTLSEIHAVMTSGFATIAGTVMAAYITFGVSPAHLLSASVMSAPAALAFAKLLYPETEERRKEAQDEGQGEGGETRKDIKIDK